MICSCAEPSITDPLTRHGANISSYIRQRSPNTPHPTPHLTPHPTPHLTPHPTTHLTPPHPTPNPRAHPTPHPTTHLTPLTPHPRLRAHPTTHHITHLTPHPTQTEHFPAGTAGHYYGPAKYLVALRTVYRNAGFISNTPNVNRDILKNISLSGPKLLP